MDGGLAFKMVDVRRLKTFKRLVNMTPDRVWKSDDQTSLDIILAEYILCNVDREAGHLFSNPGPGC